jgi:beta-phosphoglucomutase-like phosphatase (HAD superfamily)
MKALLFDPDGTLADTNSVHRLAWAKLERNAKELYCSRLKIIALI